LVSQGLAKDIAVLPADIRGVVMRPDGKTPVQDLRIMVWNQEIEKVIYETRTDENGVFELPEYKEGNYYIKVKDIHIDMTVFKTRADKRPQTHGFVIVLPKNMPINVPLIVSPFIVTLPTTVSP